MIQKYCFLLLMAAVCVGHLPVFAAAIDSLPVKDSMKFYDGHQFVTIGKFHQENNYNRFPQNYKTILRPEVWNLSQNSAGLSIRFRSNATAIAVRWTVTGNVLLPHMAATGVKGVDLYAYVKGQWQFIQTGRPGGKINEYNMFGRGEPVYREYLLNLPLYDGLDSLSIGVNTDAAISVPAEKLLMNKMPVVYYGTSIAQGACASRPGMAFTNILERKMDRSFINMGFSGNGTFDASVGAGMCETAAALYVIDCNPNTAAGLIYERAVALVKQLKQCRPEVPVLLVANFLFESNDLLKKPREEEMMKQRELKRAFDTLLKSGMVKIYYLKGDGLIGYDHEATVDGVHPTDAGMERMAAALLPRIQHIITDTQPRKK